jgi:hypothetical protein
MLEIFLLIRFGKSLSAMAKAKGRSGGWAGLGVLFWFVGEIMGFLIGDLLGLGMGSYLLGIGVAFAGAGVAYAVVKSLSPAPSFSSEFSAERSSTDQARAA